MAVRGRPSRRSPPGGDAAAGRPAPGDGGPPRQRAERAPTPEAAAPLAADRRTRPPPAPSSSAPSWPRDRRWLAPSASRGGGVRRRLTTLHAGTTWQRRVFRTRLERVEFSCGSSHRSWGKARPTIPRTPLTRRHSVAELRSPAIHRRGRRTAGSGVKGSQRRARSSASARGHAMGSITCPDSVGLRCCRGIGVRRRRALTRGVCGLGSCRAASAMAGRTVAFHPVQCGEDDGDDAQHGGLLMARLANAKCSRVVPASVCVSRATSPWRQASPARRR